MTVDQFKAVNGFSNLFWGWGGEDDDMANRLRLKKLFISRYPANIARWVPVTVPVTVSVSTFTQKKSFLAKYGNLDG